MRVACSIMSSRNSAPLVDVPLQRLLLELSDELRRGRNPDVGGDQNLLDSLPELLVLDVPELRNGGVELSDERRAAAAETLPQPAKPPARSCRSAIAQRLASGSVSSISQTSSGAGSFLSACTSSAGGTSASDSRSASRRPLLLRHLRWSVPARWLRPGHSPALHLCFV